MGLDFNPDVVPPVIPALKDVKRAVRKIQRASHPDRLPPGLSDAERSHAEKQWDIATRANEHLLHRDPAFKAEYDWFSYRFGDVPDLAEIVPGVFLGSAVSMEQEMPQRKLLPIII